MSNTVIANSRLLIMVKVPVSILIIKQVLINFIQYFILLILNLIVLYIYGIPISKVIILLPLALIPLIFLATSVGLVNAIIKVLIVDLSRFIDAFMGILLFITPIIYSPKIELGILKFITPYNPLTYLIATPRSILVGQAIESSMRFVVISFCCVPILMLSYYYFTKSIRICLDRLINN